jgi:hypothetical protein
MTPFSELQDLFSSVQTDYEHLSLPTETQDEIFDGWLLNAIGEFDNCKEDLYDRDMELRQFNVTLSDKSKKVLVKYILVEWLNPKLYNIENLKNYMTNKDFNQFSPSAMLKEIRETHNKAFKEANREKVAYGHFYFDPQKELIR